MLRPAAFVLIAVVVGGCATRAEVPLHELGRTEHFRVLRIGAPMSLAELSQRLFGDPARSEALARANRLAPRARLAVGDVIAQPLSPINTAHVSAEGARQVQLLCYHRFAERAAADPMVVARADFDAQMRYLRDNGYQVVRLADYEAMRARRLPVPERAVVLTFDDGYRSVADIAAPILARYGYPATLFVYPQFIGGGHALSWQQLRELVATGLFDVHSHALSHTSLVPAVGETPTTYGARIQREVEVAATVLEQQLGQSPRYFAYPYGDVTQPVVELLQASGYALGLTVARGGSPVFGSPWLIRRTMIYGGDDIETFARRLQTFQAASTR
jgi:peptidoglycan/xylan/chitin deacetylase (PgdA/CDA1 family)